MDVTNYPHVGEQRARGIAQGRARGHAESILRILDKRGVVLTDANRERILSCMDMQTLDPWLDLSLTVSTVGEMFDIEALAGIGSTI